MQHKNKTKEFGRTMSQRKALWRTMLGSLIMKEKIQTTEAKAKELKARIDKVINKAKKGQDETRKLSVRRELTKDIPQIAVKKLIGKFLTRFDGKACGYTRVVKLAPRKSDGARIAIIEFI
jgi:large subunit ribosomal protein L17